MEPRSVRPASSRRASPKTIEIGLVVLIATILGISFRSLTIPLVSLAGVFVSIGGTFVLLAWIASAFLHQTVIYLIPLILIVILLSLGNDYAVFLLSRIVEEGRTHRLVEAIPRGIAFSGVVVTSLGLILAASLGSLALQPVSFLEQLGLAFGLSLVLDTFVIRILYFPAALGTVRPPSIGVRPAAGGGPARTRGPRGPGPERGVPVERVEVRYLRLRRGEALPERLLRVAARVDLGDRPRLEVDAGDEVDPACGPAGRAARAVPSLEPLGLCIERLVLRSPVQEGGRRPLPSPGARPPRRAHVLSAPHCSGAGEAP